MKIHHQSEIIRRREGGGEALKSGRKAIHVNGEALKGDRNAVKDNGMR